LQTIALGHVAFDLLEKEQSFELSIHCVCCLSLVRWKDKAFRCV